MPRMHIVTCLFRNGFEPCESCEGSLYNAVQSLEIRMHGYEEREEKEALSCPVPPIIDDPPIFLSPNLPVSLPPSSSSPSLLSSSRLPQSDITVKECRPRENAKPSGFPLPSPSPPSSPLLSLYTTHCPSLWPSPGFCL
ncbi:hypothetical protein L249_6649 [Ophiocordyceps polyrhachis-furcata BCC 54312]|uniref:Uncharacterized protein n=1 Tax=Ophiocordyceps polyrhachis-furcata BCC 54312 TaxID=1330021 RepID=A0A367LJG2_9HYPO|nr:hypothetical protein L249_6649 [Ophiocordyceps polyrhachis-furcata BCC 54312]